MNLSVILKALRIIFMISLAYLILEVKNFEVFFVKLPNRQKLQLIQHVR